MPEPRFKDSWKRIDRAIAHAKSVVNQWAELFDPSAEPTVERRGPRRFVARVAVTRHKDNDIGLELGEFFYQLRASLDGLAYEAMALATGCDPPPKVDRVEFPIYLDHDRFTECPFIKLTDFPKELTDWLESIQPYRIGLSPDPAINELGRRLRLLHDCARKDRHRKLHVVVAGITKMGVHVSHTPNITISNVHPIPINFLTNATDFLGFDADFIGVGRRSITVRVDGDIEFGIVEFPDHVGQGVVEELERIILAARHVVEVFERGYGA